MTIPSALALLVNVFPDPLQQARAIGLFGGCGSMAVGKESAHLPVYNKRHGSFSFWPPDWRNIRRMGVLPLGVLVYSNCGCTSGSVRLFHYTTTNCGDYRKF